MKIIDGLKLKGKPAEIPDCSRDDLSQFFVEMGYKVGAEIGVYKGEYTEKFCRVGLKMFGIDPWIGYKGAGRSEQKQDTQNINYECTKETLAPYKNCKLIRKTSMKALNDFKPKSLDFVYIDGDHRFRYVAEDLYEWFDKVKKGGILAGHDYFSTWHGARNVIIQVKPVVDAFIQAYNIPNFYTLGDKDKTLSWMFFKP